MTSPDLVEANAHLPFVWGEEIQVDIYCSKPVTGVEASCFEAVLTDASQDKGSVQLSACGERRGFMQTILTQLLWQKTVLSFKWHRVEIMP